MSVNMSRPGQESVINIINSQNTPHCPLLFVHLLGLIIILENEHNALHWTWTPTESRLNGFFFIISIAKWQETKGNRIEPSPCNAGIMVKLLKLSAACVLFYVEGDGKKAASAFIYFHHLSESLLFWHSKYACGEWGNCHILAEVRTWIKWTGL